MNNLAVAYHEWSQEITYDNTEHKFKHGKGVDKIRTRGGELYTTSEWMETALSYVNSQNKSNLLNSIMTYVTENCEWLDFSEITEYSVNCVLNESYKKWEDFKWREV